jgi:hypothetical protein
MNSANTQNEKPKRSLKQKVDRNFVEIIGIFFVIILGISPFLFTNYNLFGIDFANNPSSQIGSTIGGITAPFVGILAAFLVYQSFNKQREANKRTNDIFTRSIKMSYYEEMVRQIEFTNNQFDSIKLKNKQGGEAFYSLDKDLNNADEEFKNQYLLLLDIIDFTVNSVLEFPRDRNRNIDNFDYYRSLELKVSYFILAKYSQIKDFKTEQILENIINNKIIERTEQINKKLLNFQ